MKSSATILLVEDEYDLRVLVARQLELEGFTIEQAGSVAEALQLITSARFDLVLLDVLLTDGTGLDVLRFMNERGICIPVIVLTGTSGLDIAVESVKLGAKGYVSKPARIPYLISSVKELLPVNSNGTSKR